MQYWPIVLSLLALVAWLIRLEAKVTHCEEHDDELREDVRRLEKDSKRERESLEAYLDRFESRIFEKMDELAKTTHEVSGKVEALLKTSGLRRRDDL